MLNNSGKAVVRAGGALRSFSRFLELAGVPAKILFLALLHTPVPAFSATLPGSYSAILEWDANPCCEVAGYKVYSGVASRIYTNIVVLGNVTSNQLANLAGGSTYFFAITAYDANGLESDFSNEVNYLPGLPGLWTRVTSTGQAVLKVYGLIGHTYDILATQNLVDWVTIGTVTLGATGSREFTDVNAANFPRRFYRTRETQPTLRTSVASTGQAVLKVYGQIGHTYDILATHNLVDWMVIGTVILGASGSLDFTDVSAAYFPERYYRIRESPP